MMKAWMIMTLAILLSPVGAQTPSAQTGSELQVFLVTMGPGATVYERYGHNAIWIRNNVTRDDLVYNYGTFDFAAPGFVMNFVKGRPRYWLGVSTLDQTIRSYEHSRRNVYAQELNLLPVGRAELARFLATNAQPENREYRYDYFLDNCSTRVRDALDLVLGGALRRETERDPAEGDFRFHTQRSLTNDLMMYTGIMLGQGLRTDQPINQWAEMFLPAKVQERVRELRVSDASGTLVPLVASETTLLAIDMFAVDATPPAWGAAFQVAGLLIAGVIMMTLFKGAAGTIGRVTATAWLLVSGIGGVVLLFLWFGTDHVFSASNRNVLFMSPLALFLVPAMWRRTPNGPERIALGAAALLVVSLTAGAVLALAPSLGGQWNMQVMQLATLPGVASCVVATLLTRRRAAMPLPPR